MKIIHVVGTRPNLIKLAPVWNEIKIQTSYDQMIIHTGQHYDVNMSQVFINELKIPKPNVNINIGSGTHAQQTANIMIKIEHVLEKIKPDLVLIYGDVNSTIAAALVCSKLFIPVGHVEAGLRSFDKTMPEEINRILTDQISDLLFTPSKDGNINLEREGIDKKKIYFVGNVMIDTLFQMLPKANLPNIKGLCKDYILVTLHRPSNVDQSKVLISIVNTLKEIGRTNQILFPMHPRTKKMFKEYNIVLSDKDNIKILDPIGYLDFLGLIKNSLVVITDSGGIQEETTYLNIPCLTLRENTERPITINMGTNKLIGLDMVRLQNEITEITNGKIKQGKNPPLWDGKASLRIVNIIQDYL